MRRKNFYIARIDKEIEKETKEQNKSEDQKFRPEPFVSTISGYNVKDKPSFPYIKWNNRGSQYEGLRDRRKMRSSTFCGKQVMRKT